MATRDFLKSLTKDQLIDRLNAAVERANEPNVNLVARNQALSQENDILRKALTEEREHARRVEEERARMRVRADRLCKVLVEEVLNASI
jgi:regulator of replication initiation timing